MIAKDVNNIIKEKMIIIIDSREKKIDHIKDNFDKANIKYEIQKLDYADYSIRFGERNLFDICSIERKATLDELSINLTSKREQFKKEIERAKGRFILLIEKGSFKKIGLHKYKSEFNPKSYIASLMTFQARYNNFSFIFIDSTSTANFIYSTMFYVCRELYLKGELN